MSIVNLVVFINYAFIVWGKNIFSYLLEVLLKTVDEIFENVRLVCLKVEFKEHVVCNYDC